MKLKIIVHVCRDRQHAITELFKRHTPYIIRAAQGEAQLGDLVHKFIPVERLLERLQGMEIYELNDPDHLMNEEQRGQAATRIRR
mgnify:CR=1 FL=1